MQIHDNLFDDCCQCCVKHLEAAYALCVDSPARDLFTQGPCDNAALLIGRARINFVESTEGYPSHFDYALGLLVRAEEDTVAAADYDTADDRRKAIRRVRLDIMENGYTESAATALLCLRPDMLRAHVYEAFREFPALAGSGDAAAALRATGTSSILWPDAPVMAAMLRECLDWLRDNFFGMTGDEQPAMPGENHDSAKGGDENMATAKKAPAKKAPAKAAAKKAPAFLGKQAACKGGKAKKGKC